MALRVALLRLDARAPAAARTALSARRAAGGSCAGPAPPPPRAPCRPAPRPPCRAPPPAAPATVRLVCRPPPPAARPPCPPRASRPPLTCHHARPPRADRCTPKGEDSGRAGPRGACCVEQDYVARRLTLAKRARRAEYEQEAAARAAASACRRSPPRTSYRLGDERGEGAPSADDNCRHRSRAHLDPCAHRPTVVVEIDRSTRPAPPAAPAAPAAEPDELPSVPRGIGSRLMSGLKLSRDSREPTPPPRPTSAPGRLRGRSAKPGYDRRSLHTSATSRAADSGAVDGMIEIVRGRSQLGEAGRGRVAVDSRCGGAGAARGAGGSLELRVPADVSRVRVRVSLESAASGTASTPSEPARVPSAGRLGGADEDVTHVARSRCLASAGPPEGDSWLTLKNIQRKLAGRRNAPESPPPRETKKPPVAPSPCSPPAPPRGPSPAPPRCPSPAPPRGPSPSAPPRLPCPPKKIVKPSCPKPEPRSPCPPKKPTSDKSNGCGGGKSSPTAPPRRPSAPVCPSGSGRGESHKTPPGSARFSPTLALIFNTVVN